MLVYKFVKLFYFSFICSFGFCGNLSSSMSACGDVSDTLVSLLLPVASGTSVTHSVIAFVCPFFWSYHILMSSVTLTLLLNRCTAPWNLFVKCNE